MAELRWLLLVVGLVAIAGIYLYTRFKPRLERGLEALTTRREPTLAAETDSEPTLAVATDSEPGDTEIPVLDTPVSPPEIATPEPETEPAPEETKIIAIRLLARAGQGFPADKLILTMRELGLKHGEFGIFHRASDADDADSEFSVASLVEPGSFDLARIKSDSYPGVSIFMRLPGVRDGVEIFDDMLQTSRSLARRLNGELLDEQGSSLSVQRERYLREEVIQFEHQGIS